MLTPPFSFDRDHGAARRRALLRRVRRSATAASQGRRRQVRRGDELEPAQRLAGHGYDLVAGLAAAGARQGAGAERALLRGGAGPRRRPGAAARSRQGEVVPQARRHAGRQRHRSPEHRADGVLAERWSRRSAARSRATSICRRAAARASPRTSTPTTSIAVHVEGTKTWHVYEGRAKDPIAHPMFRSLTAEQHEKARGGKLMDVQMEPGDLLYLPRGQYHDALADEGGAVHIAFGVTYPIGVDVMSLLFERVIAEPRVPRQPAAARAARCRRPARRASRGARRAPRRGAGRPGHPAADRPAAAELSLSAPRLRPAGPSGRGRGRALRRARQGHPPGPAGRALRPGARGLARGDRGAGRGQRHGRLGARAPASSRRASSRRPFPSARPASATSCCATSARCA